MANNQVTFINVLEFYLGAERLVRIIKFLSRVIHRVSGMEIKMRCAKCHGIMPMDNLEFCANHKQHCIVEDIDA